MFRGVCPSLNTHIMRPCLYLPPYMWLLQIEQWEYKTEAGGFSVNDNTQYATDWTYRFENMLSTTKKLTITGSHTSSIFFWASSGTHALMLRITSLEPVSSLPVSVHDEIKLHILRHSPLLPYELLPWSVTPTLVSFRWGSCSKGWWEDFWSLS